MSQDKTPAPEKDTSRPGREEEVIKNDDKKESGTGGSSHMTKLPADHSIGETEGERRFKEGMANNSDTDK